jgi:hypothetical protein
VQITFELRRAKITRQIIPFDHGEMQECFHGKPLFHGAQRSGDIPT